MEYFIRLKVLVVHCKLHFDSHGLSIQGGPEKMAPFLYVS